MAQIQHLNFYFFFMLLLGVSAAAFMLFQPFLGAIFVAMIFAVMFHGVYKYILQLLKGRSPVVASLLTCILVIGVVLFPLFGIADIVAEEVRATVGAYMIEDSPQRLQLERVITTVTAWPLVQSLLGSYTSDDLVAAVLTWAQSSRESIFNIVQNTYHSVFSGVLNTFVMLFSLFYFFIDGKKFVKRIMHLSPLRDTHERMLITRSRSMLRATLRGTGIIGLVQGMIGGAAFLIVGVGAPVMWTIIMIILSLIPAVGASLVIVPAGIIFLLAGHMWQGIVLLAVAAFVSSIDNVLRPKLVGSDVQMNSLLVFFATIGGLTKYGLLGFITGPIVLALCLALWEIYDTEFSEDIDRFNA